MLNSRRRGSLENLVKLGLKDLFKKLRESFKKLLDTLSLTITSKEKFLSELENYRLELLSNDVAYDAVEDIITKLRNAVEHGLIVNRDDLRNYVKNIIKTYFIINPPFDIFREAFEKKFYKIVFLGINGVGKTTTIAKLAYLYREKGFRPIMVASDTFRAGAQEQLRIHSERIKVPVFTGKYGRDPASVAYDALMYARNRGFNVVLIDTAGRMHTDVDLVNELKKIVKVVEPDRKILVVDALTGNDAVEQAKFFDRYVGVDGVIVTKIDAYEEGGVPISIVYSINKPILMVGVGQGYGDIKVFDVEEYLSNIIS